MTSYQLQFLSVALTKYEPTKVTDVRHARSMKTRECVYCGCEIVKGDYYYSYKPIFGNRKSRCLDHPPKIYNDYERFDI